MKPTYLYIKRHIDTGMLYFGKTTKSNPLKYNGSGRHWKRHLNVHGKNIETLWISELFTDKDDLVEFAEFFSECFDIVKSNRWANEKPENGLDGGREPGFKGKPNTEETRKRTSQRMKTKNPMFDSNIRIKHKEILNSESCRKKKSASKMGNKNVFGKSWYNDGTKSKMFTSMDVPTGWIKGRLNPHWNYNRKKND